MAPSKRQRGVGGERRACVRGFYGSPVETFRRHFHGIDKKTFVKRCVVSRFVVWRVARRGTQSIADAPRHLMEIFLGSGCLGVGCFLTSICRVPFSYLDSILEKSVFSGMRSARL